MKLSIIFRIDISNDGKVSLDVRNIESNENLNGLTLPKCYTENDLVSKTEKSCMIDKNTPIQTCIHNKIIYTTKWNHCVSIYGINIEDHTLKVFQKKDDISSQNVSNYIDVSHSLKDIMLYQNQEIPIFVIYDCNSDGCIQTSGYIKYRTLSSNSNLKDSTIDKFVVCYENDPKGCHKLEYILDDGDGVSNCSEINQGKILYYTSANYLSASFKICLPIITSITSSNDPAWKFITLSSNAKIDQLFTMPLAKNSPFLNMELSLISLSSNQQYYIMKITNDIYASYKGNLENGYYLNSGIVDDSAKPLFKYNGDIIEFINFKNGYYLIYNNNKQKLHQNIANNIVPVKKDIIGYYWNEDENEVIFCGIADTLSFQCQVTQVPESTSSKVTYSNTLIHQKDGFKYYLNNEKVISFPSDDNTYFYYPFTSYSSNKIITSEKIINAVFKVSKYSLQLVVNQVIYIDNYTNKLVSENEFNSCSSLITKYQINNSGIALAYPCCNYNSKESSGISGNYLLNNEVYNCIEAPTYSTIKNSCYKLTENDSFNGLKIFMNLKSSNYNLSVEINHPNKINEELIDNINLYDCFKNECSLTNGYFKYGNNETPSSLVKCDRIQCQKETIPIDSCEDEPSSSTTSTINSILKVKYDYTNDVFQLCDEANQFKTISLSSSSQEDFINITKNSSLIKMTKSVIGISQYSMSLPICSSVSDERPCLTGTNTVVETCIFKNKIYKTRYNKCFLTYGYLPVTGVKIFQKGTNSLDFKDVTGKMDSIALNINENQPYFVIYDCLENQCFQTSGFVRYKLANSPEMKDQFMACYSQSSIGCQKMEYAATNECSNSDNFNEGKIKFMPVGDTSVLAELQICMDTSGKANGPKNLRFISISIDYRIENYFAMYMGRTLFPDTISEQNVIMRVTYDAFVLIKQKLNYGYYINSGHINNDYNTTTILYKDNDSFELINAEIGDYYLIKTGIGNRIHQVVNDSFYRIDIDDIKDGIFWGTNNNIIECSKTNGCTSIIYNSNNDCVQIGTITKDINDSDFKYCYDKTTKLDLPKNGFLYYPLIVNSTYSYPKYIKSYSGNTNFGLIEVSKTSVTQILDQIIYLNTDYQKVSKDEFEKCEHPITKYECKDTGFCILTSCGNIDIDEKCESDFYYINKYLYNCIRFPTINSIKYDCSDLSIKNNNSGLFVFKKKENNIYTIINNMDTLTDEHIPLLNIFDCYRSKCTKTNGYIRYNNKSSLAKCTIDHCEKVEASPSYCHSITTSSNGYCGSSYNNTICRNNECCGSEGKCGSGSSYCTNRCNIEYGKCTIDNSEISTYNILQARLENDKFQLCNQNNEFMNLISSTEEENFHIINGDLTFARSKTNIIGLAQHGPFLPLCYFTSNQDACKIGVNNYVDFCIYNNIIYSNNNDNNCIDIYGKIEKPGIKIFQKGMKKFEYTDVTNNLDKITINRNNLNSYFLLYNCTNSVCQRYNENYKINISSTKEYEFICYEKEYLCYISNSSFDYNYIDDNNHNTSDSVQK